MAEPTIAAGYPKSLLMFAVARGADRHALLDRSELSSLDLSDLDARIPLKRYIALFREASDMCEEPALALLFGEAVRMQDISIVGLICEVADTAAEVGRQLNRYARLVVDDPAGGEWVQASPAKDGLWMRIASASYLANPPMVEAELARLVCNTRSTFAAVPEFQAMAFPMAAHFTHPEPPYAAQYARIFRCPIVFESDQNALLFDYRFPRLNQPPTDRLVFGALTLRADGLLRALETSKTIRSRAETILISGLHTGDATIDLVANKLGFSRRTLQRKLREEGAPFETVLDELRHTMAVRYLDGKKVSTNETAYLLGFSEPAAFSRAFRRWTGQSPGSFRTR